MSREIDEACARALGWEGVGIACMMGPYEDLYYKSHTNDGYDVVPEFSVDPSDVRELEDEIEQRGLWAEYTEALIKCVGVPHPTWEPWSLEDVWNMIYRTTPEQRAQAFLMAIDSEV